MSLRHSPVLRSAFRRPHSAPTRQGFGSSRSRRLVPYAAAGFAIAGTAWVIWEGTAWLRAAKQWYEDRKGALKDKMASAQESYAEKKATVSESYTEKKAIVSGKLSETKEAAKDRVASAREQMRNRRENAAAATQTAAADEAGERETTGPSQDEPEQSAEEKPKWRRAQDWVRKRRDSE